MSKKNVLCDPETRKLPVNVKVLLHIRLSLEHSVEMMILKGYFHFCSLNSLYINLPL